MTRTEKELQLRANAVERLHLVLYSPFTAEHQQQVEALEALYQRLLATPTTDRS